MICNEERPSVLCRTLSQQSVPVYIKCSPPSIVNAFSTLTESRHVGIALVLALAISESVQMVLSLASTLDKPNLVGMAN